MSKINHRYLVLTTGILLIAVLSAVFIGNLFKKNSNLLTDNDKIQVMTSFYPIYFFASQVGGDLIQVKNIIPFGFEPHEYELTVKDVVQIQSSDLLILNGGVEAWQEKIKNNLQGKKTKIVIAGEGLLTQQLTKDNQTSQDPHIWLNPQLAKKESQKIADALIKIDPQHTVYYQDNQSNLAKRLDELDGLFKDGLRACQQTDIITAHAAFGYLVLAYGLNQVSIAGISADTEPSTQQLAGIVNFAKQKKVKYIFFENLVSPKLSETIALEIGVKTLVLDPLEGLSDNDIVKGRDYFSVMQDNLSNLRLALECT